MTHLTWTDYTLFVLYLLASVGVGALFVKEQKTTKDYFLAGRSMGSIVVAISVLAALFSGITYLGAPSEVYAHDLSFALVSLAFFVATPIATLIFLPLYYQSRFYTAYQYLEERFSVSVRTLASALFIIRVLLWLGLATYAPALALQTVTGLPLWFTISATAILTTIYTTLGGMKAVIWTDIMQFVVLFGGQLVIFIVALSRIPGGVGEAYRLALEGEKFTLSFSLDPTVRVTLWGLILGGAFMHLVQMGTDQVSVQRYYTASSLKTAQRSLWLKLGAVLPVAVVFYASGAVLFAFYKVHGDPLAAQAIPKADYILPYFVVTELPRGMPGLLVSAIFAASMSTISAGINALTTATLVDFYERLGHHEQPFEHQVTLARLWTVIYGLVVMALAFVVQRLGTLVEASNKAIGLVGGPLIGLFLLGMTTRRANDKGALLGWGAGLAVLIPLCFCTKVSFLWYALVGCVVTYGVGWIVSLFFAPPRDEQLEGLIVQRKPLSEAAVSVPHSREP
ncbi:MAG: sodium:solute symporter family transporter [Candidatus Zipacnadales bacterium]